MAKENLELIIHDEYRVLTNLQIIEDLLSVPQVDPDRVADNQRGIVMLMRDMQKYITMLAEQLKEISD